MSLPALMALMGHLTPQMALRYAKLASPTIRSAYQTAMNKVRAGQLLPITVVDGTPAVPDKVQWLHSEMLKTRLAHGFCARPKAAGPWHAENVPSEQPRPAPGSNTAPTETTYARAGEPPIHRYRFNRSRCLRDR
jgi:hypothetical protein